MLADLGGTITNIDTLEKDWIISKGGIDAQINDQWLDLFLKNGATSANWNTAALQSIQSLGFTGSNLTDGWQWFWCVNGGVIVPANAILDRDGNAILDRDGNFIVTRT